VAGYSGTPLAKKLGITVGMAVAAPGAPPGFLESLGPLPEGLRWKTVIRPPIDLIVAFFTDRVELSKHWASLSRAAGPWGTVWVAWPKRSSGVVTDITEDVLRTVLLPTGWVDVKVCAIDDTWSGLKFVMRKELRP
jgi:hypothetical protein